MSFLKPETASQTAGPYVHIGCTPNHAGVVGVYDKDLGKLVKDKNIEGEQITIKGAVFDGYGEPLCDAMIEIWQADAKGVYNSHHKSDEKKNTSFTGWGRCASDMKTGEFVFETIKPGKVVDASAKLHAPHITFWIVARGINLGLHTRLYFSDEEDANSTDPILSSITDKKRIPTLIAKLTKAGIYQFDIHLQGAKETIFLDI